MMSFFQDINTMTKGFITSQGLVELKNYKYKPGKYTIIDNLLNPYWQWFVKRFPESVAPNLITFIGWIFVIVSYANILRYDYTFQKDIPNWCFLLAGACVWIYSTLDAVDGKQARRTKSSSPLGQLFDHGCDSFSVTFFVLALSQAAKLSGIEVFVIFVACHSAFWFANWSQYNTGILTTNVGQFGVTEVELVSMLVHIITGIFGQQFWQIKISDVLPAMQLSNTDHNMILQWVLNLNLGGFLALFFGTLIFLSCAYVFFQTILSSEDKIKPIRECFSFYFVLSLVVVWFYTSLYDHFKGMILLNFGLLFSLIICKVIISSVAKMPLPYFHEQIIPMIVGTILIVICDYLGQHDLMEYIFWLIFVVNIWIIINFVVKVVKQITEYLGIYCFSLKKRSTDKKKT